MPNKSRPRRPTLYAYVGLPASGKSTDAKKRVAAAKPGTAVRLNKDDERRKLHDSVFGGHPTESQVIASRDTLTVLFLTDGVDVYVDDTNLEPHNLKRLSELAFECDAHFEILDFTDVPVEECIRRDADREGKVGEKVIRKMARTLGKKRVTGGLGLIVPPPPFDPALPTVVLCDIDGTLAVMGDRGAYDFAKVGIDAPNPPVVTAVQRLRQAGMTVIAFSGRDSSCRSQTEAWIREHVGTGIDLYMREAGDQRRDSVVKHEMFHRYIAGNYNVAFVLDDRDQVVRTWRSMGIPCFQVAPGRF